MTPLYGFQFFVYCICIHLFTIFTCFIYYGDLLSLYFRSEIQPVYDYIIVGSGTAGSVIAHRLATETNNTFIVLEAGSRSTVLHDIPIVGPVMHGSLYDWHYETEPQEAACFAMEANKCTLPQGKILGGSSKLNNMVHVRGNTSHYVKWFHGKYTEEYIYQQFEFIESNIINLDNIQYESELANGILDAAKELGYSNLDLESGLGFMKSKVSQRNGKRWSTVDNLTSKNIITNALVQRILIRGTKAFGVDFLLADEKRTIHATEGVILSAGTYNTPKILQLSGIGPSNLLKSLGIKNIKDLPVGKNLQDHIATGLDLVVFNQSLSIGARDIVNPLNMLQYFLFGKGPLTTPGCEVIGFLSTKNESTPDLQFMVLPVGIASDRGSYLRKSLKIKDEVWQDYFAQNFDKHTATILPIILHPESRGEVYITSKDPAKPPLINPQLLSNDKDRETLVKGLKLVSQFVATDALKALGAYMNPIHFPGCEKHKIFSDPYWRCYIKHLTLPSYHPVGTCSMGVPKSQNAVVDTSFRVIGVDKLYVADASVLPTLPSGNINAAVAMMGSLFFDTNIKSKSNYNKYAKIQTCPKYDLKYNYFYNVCLQK